MNPLVTPSWLSDRLHNAVVLDATLSPPGVKPPVDTRASYAAKHIPGAVFFDIEAFSDHANPAPHMLLEAEAFSRGLSALGVGDEMDIVVYEQEGVFSAPRVWWMLKTFGAERVYLLDGGLRAWCDAGLSTESGEVVRAPAVFQARLDRDAVKDFSQMQTLIAGRAQILDARSGGRFSGVVAEPRAGLSSGHMPGARSVPFTELVEDGRMRSAEELRKIFAAKGVDREWPITTTCGSGVTAAVIVLALEIAGAGEVSLYDGSWAEYAVQPGALIEKTAR
jgi:thiosulfate/3-mercaptopyruvate sulfurtransferase